MPAEQRFGYVEDMPEDVRSLYVELCEDAVSLWHKWEFYLELFGKRENAVLLADLTRASFYVLSELLGDGITMAICRLEDPAQQGKYKNLTIHALKEKCSDIPEINDLCDRLHAACEPFRRHRDKRIGHSDLDTTIDPIRHPLPGINQPQVEAALCAIEQILKAVHARYSEAEICTFAPFHVGGAKDLMYWIKRGLEHHQEERDRLGVPRLPY
jgi:AbiU2